MTPELERMARAIFDLTIYQGYNAETKERLWQGARAICIDHARAALLSIREPSEGMVKAGEAVDCEASAGWTMMVDYVLGEFNP